MRQNISGYTIITANKILNNHWEWMENNKNTDKKIIVKEIIGSLLKEPKI